MGRAVGGASAAGCGVFSLVGVLVAVVIVVLLATNVIGGDDGGGVDDLPKRTKGAPDAALAIDPADDLEEGSFVTVRGSGLEPGDLLITTCLTSLVEAGGTTACDPGTDVAAAVDGDGRLDTAVTVNRLITVGDSTFDCAAAEGGCALLAHLPDSGEGPIAVLLFAEDLPEVEGDPPPMR